MLPPYIPTFPFWQRVVANKEKINNTEYEI